MVLHRDTFFSFPAHLPFPFVTVLISHLGLPQMLVEDYESWSQEERKITHEVPYVRARLNNYRPLTSMKHLGAAYCGKLVAVNATVVRASNAKPLCLSLAFQCRSCSSLMMAPQVDGKFQPPSRCTALKNGVPCTGMQLQPCRGSTKNLIVEWQTIRLQEKSSDGLVSRQQLQ